MKSTPGAEIDGTPAMPHSATRAEDANNERGELYLRSGAGYAASRDVAGCLRHRDLRLRRDHLRRSDTHRPRGDAAIEWIRLFPTNGLVVEDLVVPRPPTDAFSSYRTETDRAWPRRWPAECIWVLQRG
jgi:hypothetical protein